MSQLVFGDDLDKSKKKIQPVLIGHKAKIERINDAKKLITDTQRPILMEYSIKDNKIEFRRVL